jgi:hypothetical protein
MTYVAVVAHAAICQPEILHTSAYRGLHGEIVQQLLVRKLGLDIGDHYVLGERLAGSLSIPLVLVSRLSLGCRRLTLATSTFFGTGMDWSSE